MTRNLERYVGGGEVGARFLHNATCTTVYVYKQVGSFGGIFLSAFAFGGFGDV